MDAKNNPRIKRVVKRLQKTSQKKTVSFLNEIWALVWASEIVSLLLRGGGAQIVIGKIILQYLGSFKLLVRLLLALFRDDADLLLQLIRVSELQSLTFFETHVGSASHLLHPRINYERIKMLDPISIRTDHRTMAGSYTKVVDLIWHTGSFWKFISVIFNPKFRLLTTFSTYRSYDKIEIIAYSGIPRKTTGQILYLFQINSHYEKVHNFEWSPNGEYLLVTLRPKAYLSFNLPPNLPFEDWRKKQYGRIKILKYFRSKHCVREVKGFENFDWVNIFKAGSNLWRSDNSFILPTAGGLIEITLSGENNTYKEKCLISRSPVDSLFPSFMGGVEFGCATTTPFYKNYIFYVKKCDSSVMKKNSPIHEHDVIGIFNLTTQKDEGYISCPFYISEMRCHKNEVFVSMVEPCASSAYECYIDKPTETPVPIFYQDVCPYSEPPWIGKTRMKWHRARMFFFSLNEQGVPQITNRLTNNERWVKVKRHDKNFEPGEKLTKQEDRHRLTSIASSKKMSINDNFILFTCPNTLNVCTFKIMKNHEITNFFCPDKVQVGGGEIRSIAYTHPSKPLYFIEDEIDFKTFYCVLLGPEALNEDKKNYPVKEAKFRQISSLYSVEYNEPVKFINCSRADDTN